MKKIIKVGDGKTKRIQVEAAQKGEHKFVRLQEFYKTKNMEDFAPGRGGISIPLDKSGSVRAAIRLVSEAAEGGDIKQLDDISPAKKKKKRVVESEEEE